MVPLVGPGLQMSLTHCAIGWPRALYFFQDWWAKVTHEATNDGSFFEVISQSISN